MNAVNLQSSRLSGISEDEAKHLLERHGFNELPTAKKRNLIRIAFDVIKEPMFLLLVACGVIYLLLGSLEEALMLLAFVFLVIGITIYQERRTERVLEALRDLTSPRALVIRGETHLRIPGREVVPGDLCMIAEGDRIAADAYVLSATNLSVDESLLTGESLPVQKEMWDERERVIRPGGDDQSAVYSGTLVIAGKALCRVFATGEKTEIGKIGKALRTIEPEETLLQKETTVVVRRIAIIGLLLCAIVVVTFGFTRGNWLQGFLAGITLAMAMLPEEFPVVLTIFFALGAWRIAKHGVLTRRVPAVEMLGSATVLCVDKTGTLTMNKMSVSRIVVGKEILDQPLLKKEFPELFHQIVEYSILASHNDPFDPMEKAFLHLGEKFLKGTEHLHKDWGLVQEYPLSPALLAMSEVWQSPDGQDFVIAAKGSPEAIIDLCHMNDAEKIHAHAQVEKMAKDGLRVLGVAKALFRGPHLPGIQHDFSFVFVGFMGLADPLRESVPAAIDECHTAGIRVVMITGDHPVTAEAIAKKAGLSHPENIITGEELNTIDDTELRRRILTVSVFARVIPEQKLRLVQALKDGGEIVAMTGDGVNDAPALKAAHIGIAMGGRGTDVAREASSLVLVDDDFSSIVQAVRMGRRIFDNLKNAMAYILAIHVPIAGLSLLPVFLRWPLALLPVHIMFLELIIDPSCSIIFEMEPAEKGIMNRPPRDPKVPIFQMRYVLTNLLRGMIVLAAVFALYAFALQQGWSEDHARAITFATLVIANFSLILSMRSQTQSIIKNFATPNRSVWWIAGSALLFLILIFSVSFLRSLFHVTALSQRDVLIVAAAVAFCVVGFEGVKWIRRSS